MRLHVAPRAAGHAAPARPARNWRTPWFARNAARKLAGNDHSSAGSADQIDDDLGHDQALDEVLASSRRWARKSRSEGPSPLSPIRRARLAVEAHEVGEHAVKARVERVGGLREQPERPARPLEAAFRVRDREAHVGRLSGDPELVEQAVEVGVVAVVEDDEAGVDVPPARRRSRP